MSKNDGKYWDQAVAIINTPEWKQWEAQGRATFSQAGSRGEIYDRTATQYAQLKAQDKQLSNYYKVITGNEATPDIINKYANYASDPALLAAAINKESATAPETGQFKDKINTMVSDTMGRPATAAEQEYFGKQMEQGNLDSYGLGEFLSGTTEYQTKASDTARTKLAGELGAVDQSYLDKTKNALESKYAAMGRPGASAFGSALINAGKDLATERTGYLAGLGYQDFQQGQGNLTSAYQNRLNQMYNAQQGVSALGSESRNRYYSQQDYDRQAAAQERLRQLSQPKQGSFLQGIAPGSITAAGTIGGALIGGPAGAMVGSQVGGYLSPKLSVNNAYGRY